MAPVYPVARRACRSPETEADVRLERRPEVAVLQRGDGSGSVAYMESYQDDVAPVVELGKAGLKDIWIHLAWPLHEYDTREKRQARLRWERALEARVMGDKYDAETRGKWKVKGRWMEYG